MKLRERRKRLRLAGLAFIVLAGAIAPVCGDENQPAAPDAAKPQFERDVRPILMAHCSRCHAENPRKADLDLTSAAGVMRGSASGNVVLPGKAEQSLLFEMIRDGKMPADKGSRPSPTEVETIRRWIEGGAVADASDHGDKPSPAPAVTEQEITPLLLLHCTVCHGARRKEADLDLRTRASMLRGGKSGPALVPGRPEESLIIRKLRAGEMPPFAQITKVSIKPMAPAEIDRLVQWIALGAPESSTEADVATLAPDPLVTDADRNFWAFQPPRRVAVPAVDADATIHNPIDAFIAAALRTAGLSPAAEADRMTLLRRASLDLTGLLPEPDEIDAFLSDQSPLAYERLIDRLLASPRYGERWGRHWLDLAGYADSDGHFGDSVRLFSFRYRDYVIRSFNADKPYDRFLLEQIAGDELADYEHAPTITPEIRDNLVATGFLRMAPDGTNPPELNYVPERLEVIADEIEILGSAVMGLTIRCARCHDHKYDPIPQRDYYRLVDVFKGAFDEHDWLRPAHRNLKQITPEDERDRQVYNQAIRAQFAPMQEQLDSRTKELQQKFLDERLPKLPDVLHADLRQILATPKDKRDEVQQYLASKFESHLRPDVAALRQLEPEFKTLADELTPKIDKFKERLLAGEGIVALWDRGEPSPTFVYRKGEYLNPGRRVGPGVPAVLTDGHTPFVAEPPWPGASKTGRRLALARWLVQAEHPLTARVMVNRIWKHHFGKGLVSTLDNFGRTGALPSHPELVDWLAREFVQSGFSIKAMHRLMLTSATYRQASSWNPEAERRDPENRLLARMPLQRADAEVLYDVLLQVAGRLDPRFFGPPDPVDVQPDGLVTALGTEAGWRRSIFVLQRRKEIPTLLADFDQPQMAPNCIERVQSTVAPQALHMTNNPLIRQLAASLCARVVREAGMGPSQQIERVYLLALARPPSPEERAASLLALQELTLAWSAAESTEHVDPGKRPLATLCHAILNSAPFLYID